MASYALPPSPLSHGHHNHVHSHSHAHSPSLSPSAPRRSAYGASNPRLLHQARSAGSLHAHSHSEPHSLEQEKFKMKNDLSLPSSNTNGHSHGPSIPRNSYALSPTVSNFSFDKTPSLSSHQHDGSHSHSHDHSHSKEHDHSHDGHDHSHGHHDHHHDSSHSSTHVEKRSRFTSLMLWATKNWPLLQTILMEKDSRRIFYFMSLNFAFMLIQAFYGFVTDSLGLLSDSIHMFFDCLALALGLFAAVASKWPASQKFPYGFSKIESLSGFGNGVFLMLISIEIIIEATERLAEGRETKRLLELFVVSSMGLAVNLVGMAAFGHHGHHGHDHSHGGHDHGHNHSHGNHSHENHSHDHSAKDHSHSHHSHTSNSHSDDHRAPSPLIPSIPPPSPLMTSFTPEPHSHSHSHDNENMRGIFLHVLADTMGSAAVIVSTIFIHYFGWPGWDPLASCLIAVLIFLSSIPLVKSSAKKLLLTIPDDAEYQLRNTLAGVSGLRGVASYSVPRFWMGDGEDKGKESVIGMIHLIATRGTDVNDLRERARAFLDGHGMDVVVQVEREGEGKCWCGGDTVGSRSPLTRSS